VVKVAFPLLEETAEEFGMPLHQQGHCITSKKRCEKSLSFSRRKVRAIEAEQTGRSSNGSYHSSSDAFEIGVPWQAAVQRSRNLSDCWQFFKQVV
jgi:hypothetical protein